MKISQLKLYVIILLNTLLLIKEILYGDHEFWEQASIKS